MGYRKRLNRAFDNARVLPLGEDTRYVMFSDCHRGTGTSYDNFLKNQHLYIAALQCYIQRGYHYIELGDGEELWENRCRDQVVNSHCEVYRMFCAMEEKCRITRLFGNHDQALEQELPEAVLLKTQDGNITIGLTHGHQADFLNSVLWKLSCFLVRYLWRPLEQFGVTDPTSAAKNYKRAGRTERRLEHWVKDKGMILITGHTHRPRINEKEYLGGRQEGIYLNTGSCVHPYGITGIELNGMQAYLVKWKMTARNDMGLCVAREVLAGPLIMHLG